MKKKLMKKMKLTQLITMILVVLIIVVGVIAIVRILSDNSDKTISVPTKASADSLKSQAIEALKNNSTSTAKTLLQEAKQQYEELGDTNNVVDTNAQLFLIEHQYSPSP